MLGPEASGNAGAFGNHCCTGGLVFSDLLSEIPEFPAANTNDDARKITNILHAIVFVLLWRKIISALSILSIPFEYKRPYSRNSPLRQTISDALMVIIRDVEAVEKHEIASSLRSS